MYNHKEIEKKWQNYWEENKTFKTENDFSKPKYYTLDMFPYPSWAGLHVGHPEWYTANDIIARYKKAKWYNVLHPMGWDAFWLPAENYAIKTWTHPRTTTDKNINTFRKQIKSLWISYDWDREIDTTDPKYYKWTQWIFLKMFEHGLAYEQDLPINYCPSCKTGLANEEVLNDFTCDRCWTKVEKKKIRQWVLAITKYADRLLKDVDKLDWPESIKEMQRNWIWKSEGCEFEMKKAPLSNSLLKEKEQEQKWSTSSPSGEDWSEDSIRVYTTRIDTVFGMTYAVLAPDHKDVEKFITPEQKEVCEKYIEEAKKKSDLDRTAENKEKTWVWTGSYVINPFNGKKVPLWIADYVLWNYGTWAVMAVPAHDTRDFAFAKKYNLPIIQSIAPYIVYEWKDAPRDWIETLNRKTIDIILENEKWEICLQIEKHSNWEHIHFIWWGIEEWETEIEAVKKELVEETWYTDFEIIWPINMSFFCGIWYRANKNKNQKCTWRAFYIKLKSSKQIKSEIDEWKHNIKWVKKEEVTRLINWDVHLKFWDKFHNWEKAFTEYWILVNSWDFDWLTSKEAQTKLIEFATKNWFGEKKVNYKLRDWLFSRQRYWGEPIPLIHLEIPNIKKLPHINNISEATDKNLAYILKREPKSWENTAWAVCHHTWKIRELIINWKVFSKIYDWIYGKIVCDYNLPLELPEVKNFAPAWDGQSPLAKVDNFVNVKLADNLVWKRETNTMPQWWGSCWYYLRYMDPHNDNALVDPEIEKYWGQIDSYVGWAEHAVLHLLYARFWHKFLFDIWVVSHDEPFYRLRNQGLIQSYIYVTDKWQSIHQDLVEEKNWEYFHKETGEKLTQKIWKMSKSLGNVINPDDIVKEYWADSLRLYEMYMAEFKDSAPWDTKNIIWVRRFLEKTERLYTSEAKIAKNDEETIKLLHKTIKKVGEDIENYKFNTAIASLMILVNNWLPKDENLTKEFKEKLAIILSPFAPHLAEELWKRLWNKESIFFANWPEYNEKLIVDDTLKIAVQVLWKVRWTIEISKDEDKKSVLEKAKNNKDVAKWLEGKNLVKEIYVPWKIVNLVVK